MLHGGLHVMWPPGARPASTACTGEYPPTNQSVQSTNLVDQVRLLVHSKLPETIRLLSFLAVRMVRNVRSNLNGGHLKSCWSWSSSHSEWKRVSITKLKVAWC